MRCANGHIVSGDYCHLCEKPAPKKKPKPLRKVSVKNSFKGKEGRYIKANIEANIRVAKQQFCLINIDKQYCWACGDTSANLSCSHIISVDKCQNDGRVEIAWDIRNLQRECIPCHGQTETRKFSHHANARVKNEFIKWYEIELQKVD